MKAQDHDKIKRQLEAVQQWRASGQSKNDWAAANDMDAKVLMGWITYEGRWRARLNGQTAAPRKRHAANQAPNFVALHIEPPTAQLTPSMITPPMITEPQTIRIECQRTQLVVHWPMLRGSYLSGLVDLLKGLRP